MSVTFEGEVHAVLLHDWGRPFTGEVLKAAAALAGLFDVDDD